MSGTKATGDQTRRAVRWLLIGEGPVTSTGIAWSVRRSESWVREILRQMVRDGEVERITEGPGKPVYYWLKGVEP